MRLEPDDQFSERNDNWIAEAFPTTAQANRQARKTALQVHRHSGWLKRLFRNILGFSFLSKLGHPSCGTVKSHLLQVDLRAPSLECLDQPPARASSQQSICACRREFPRLCFCCR